MPLQKHRNNGLCPPFVSLFTPQRHTAVSTSPSYWHSTHLICPGSRRPSLNHWTSPASSSLATGRRDASTSPRVRLPPTVAHTGGCALLSCPPCAPRRAPTPLPCQPETLGRPAIPQTAASTNPTIPQTSSRLVSPRVHSPGPPRVILAPPGDRLAAPSAAGGRIAAPVAFGFRRFFLLFGAVPLSSMQAPAEGGIASAAGVSRACPLVPKG